MTVDLEYVAAALTELHQAGEFEHTPLVRADHRAVRLGLENGFLDVFYHPDDQDDTIGFRWFTLATKGHRLAAAESIVRGQEENGWMVGEFVIVEAHELGIENPVDGDSALQYQSVVNAKEHDLNDETIVGLVRGEAENLSSVIRLYEEMVSRREKSDESIEATEHDWPTAVSALIDNATPTGMLGIIFGRFEENSVHEHVFYHPNADRTLRERIVASWDDVNTDRAQPYGDPAASSASFVHERAESVAYLRTRR